MADEDHRAALLRHFVELSEASLLEGRVAHGEDLVDQQDLRFEMGGDGERQPHPHSARNTA